MAKFKKRERPAEVPAIKAGVAKAKVTVETHIVEPAKKTDEPDGARPPKGDTSTSW